MPDRENRNLQPPWPPSLAPQRRPKTGMGTLSSRLRKLLTRIVIAAASCAFFVSVAVAFVDRPVSIWVHQHLGDTRFAFLSMSYDGHLLPIGPFSLIAGPSAVLVPLALIAPVCLALAATAGWRPNSNARTALVLCLSILFAVGLNSQIKWAFGRTWPESWLGDNPSWIRDGIFGFFPFHGGQGWSSFPSGHGTATAVLATLLWLVWPELRTLWGAIVAMVAVGLIGANYHFVSDVIAGIYLGAAVGFGSAGLMLSPRDRS